MSSCLTAPTSTTASSISCPSLQIEIVACGALAGHVREIVARRGWPAAVTPLPAVLHNRPQKIKIEAERAVVSALASGRTVALAYADCGSYGALDELCARYGVRRLPGLHCYDVFGGADFFSSSRRRHTSLTCDWSSDVCSSDLPSAARRRRGRSPARRSAARGAPPS